MLTCINSSCGVGPADVTFNEAALRQFFLCPSKFEVVVDFLTELFSYLSAIIIVVPARAQELSQRGLSSPDRIS